MAFYPGSLTTRDIRSTTWQPRGAQGTGPFVAGGITTRDKRPSTWRAHNASALGFEGCSTPPPPATDRLLFHFFHSKIKVGYICTLLEVVHVHSLYIYIDRSNKYWKQKSIPLTHIRRFPIYIHGAHDRQAVLTTVYLEVEHLFGLNKPLLFITSLTKSPASSSAIPSACSFGWSLSRMKSTYIRK